MNKKKLSSIFNTKFLLMLPFGIIALLLIIIPTIIVVIYAFVPHAKAGEAANWQIMNLTTWDIIGWSFFTSFFTTLICIVLGFTFAYLLSLNKGKVFNVFALLVMTSPIWSSTLFKLIGLRTMFDIINGAVNSTYGDQYTLLGYIYLFLPLMTLPLYQVLQGMPKNYVLASQDLGASKIRTFFSVILPYCKNALLSGVTLVFIPSMMVIAVSSYMNNASNSELVGGEIYNNAVLGLDNKLALSRASVISVVTAILLLILYFAVMYLPRWIRYGFKSYKTKKTNNDYYKFGIELKTNKKKKHDINEKLSRNEIDFNLVNITSNSDLYSANLSNKTFEGEIKE